MYIIEPMAVSGADIIASSVPERDFEAWSAATTYPKNAQVCALSEYRVGPDKLTGYNVYESQVDGNVGQDPTQDDGTSWLHKGVTERLRPFDGTVGSVASGDGAVSYTVLTTRSCDAVALFGLSAGQVRVEVFTGYDAKIFDRTVSLFDPIERDTYFELFFGEAEFSEAKLITDLPMGAGRKVKITVESGTGTAAVGSIVLGTTHHLGRTVDGTDVDVEDLSELNEDRFGNIAPVPRAQIKIVKFRFLFPTVVREKIYRRLARNAGRLVVGFQSADTEGYATLVYGLITNRNLPGEYVESKGSVEFRGVI